MTLKDTYLDQYDDLLTDKEDLIVHILHSFHKNYHFIKRLFWAHTYKT